MQTVFAMRLRHPQTSALLLSLHPLLRLRLITHPLPTSLPPPQLPPPLPLPLPLLLHLSTRSTKRRRLKNSLNRNPHTQPAPSLARRQRPPLHALQLQHPPYHPRPTPTPHLRSIAGHRLPPLPQSLLRPLEISHPILNPTPPAPSLQPHTAPPPLSLLLLQLLSSHPQPILHTSHCHPVHSRHRAERPQSLQSMQRFRIWDRKRLKISNRSLLRLLRWPHCTLLLLSRRSSAATSEKPISRNDMCPCNCNVTQARRKRDASAFL
jgi:hypothetical protein